MLKKAFFTMNDSLLLDTHTALWWAGGEPISKPSRKVITAALEHGDRVMLSPITAWEVALAQARGRVRIPTSALMWYASIIDRRGSGRLRSPPKSWSRRSTCPSRCTGIQPIGSWSPRLASTGSVWSHGTASFSTTAPRATCSCCRVELEKAESCMTTTSPASRQQRRKVKRDALGLRWPSQSPLLQFRCRIRIPPRARTRRHGNDDRT
jgi:hypothetical protein